MPFDLLDVFGDDLAEPFLIIRASKGGYQAGGWKQQKTEIKAYGVVNPASAKQLQMIPEGDQVNEATVFISPKEMFTTSGDKSGTSDVLTYRGEKYRIFNVLAYGKSGFWMAFADRMAGE